MNSRKFVAAASGALLAVAGGRVLAAEKHGHGDQGDLATLGQTRITLADAVAAAERQTGGKAMEAGVEQENGAAVYEVKVASNNAVQKVTVDAQSGKVLKVGASADGHGGDGDGEEDDD
jgi:uncharacterized membrane protein YkoI